MSKIGQLTEFGVDRSSMLADHDPALERSRTTGPRLMPDLDISSFIAEASAGGPPGDAATASAQPWDGSSGWVGGVPRAIS
jgi:hypothetical protein